MVEVAVLIAGVHAEQVMRVGDFVHQQVVDERAALGHQSRIVRLPDRQLRRVVARDPLHQVERRVPAHFDFAHVAHVEQARARAHGLVLGKDAGIFQRHVPAAKIDHLGAKAAVDGVQSRFSKFSGSGCGHSLRLNCAE